MKTTCIQPGKVSVLLLISLALLQSISLFAQDKKEGRDSNKDGKVRIRIEKEENGKKKVFEHTYDAQAFLDSSEDVHFHYLPDSLRENVDVRVWKEDFMHNHPRARFFNVPPDHLGKKFNDKTITKKFHIEQPDTNLPDHIFYFNEPVFPPDLIQDFDSPFVIDGHNLTEHSDFRGENSSSIKRLHISSGSLQGVFDITFNLPQHGDVSIVVTNVKGKRVAKDRIKNAYGRITHRLDLKKKAPGIYFIKITQNNDGLVKRVVLE